MIPADGERNEERVWSSSAVAERTGKSEEGSRTVWCRTRSFGKLKFQRESAHHVGCCSQKDQLGAESTMGETERASGET
jgi:hypothetical protein